MSTSAQTKIFGMRLGIDPKLLVAGLLVVAGVLFWYNSHGEDEGPSTPTRPAARTESSATPSTIAKSRGLVQRRGGTAAGERGTLRLRAIDATRGDIDPTLRLDLLARLQNVTEPANPRNVFEMGPSPQAAALLKQQMHGPTIVPKPLPPVMSPAQMANAKPTVAIPLKYYGFVKPVENGKSNQGFFLDGDNVLVASEGEVLKQQYLVVALTPNSARLEDIRLKQGQTLAVVPEALP
ncbi:MAG TPA: hypothetical protein VFB14_24215 [Bryobacteraceae bacterium]|jgi:hypothetical protein|nr:hypothetical protein [Bryobacteraceae bacterium]